MRSLIGENLGALIGAPLDTVGSAWMSRYGRGQYTRREVGETTHPSVSTLSFELTKRFDLDVSLVWDRIANPKIGSDGVQPQPDYFRLVLGLGLDFRSGPRAGGCPPRRRRLPSRPR